jgi:hypothetical protein
MGAFFTNVQLSTSGLDKSNLASEVINYINKLNTEAGFIKVDDEDQADKSVIVSVSEDLAWISIYDEETEEQNIRKLNKLSSLLSKEFKTSALSILVNDSDTVYIGITDNGKLKDTISNRSKKIDFNKNKPSVWSDILVDKYSFDDIKSAWQYKSIFVEDFLTQFGKFINLDTSKVLTGYEYLNENNLTKEIKLNFAQKDKKKVAELGLTKFSMVAGAGLVDVKTGEKQTTEWIMTNQGASSSGVDIIVAGECIEKDLLIPNLVNTSLFKPLNGKQNEFSASFIATTSTTGEKIFHARIEDISIPKGFQPTFPMTPKESKRYGYIRYDCAIRFRISFIGGKEGIGEFTIFFCPLVNRQEGAFTFTSKKGQFEDWRNKNAL